MPLLFVLPNKEVFSLREASRLLGFDRETLRRGIESGKIVAVDIPHYGLDGLKTWKQIPRHEVERLARQKGLIDAGDSPENVQS